MPPCVVMERGESLDIWSARARPDRIQAFSVCLLSHQDGQVVAVSLAFYFVWVSKEYVLCDVLRSACGLMADFTLSACRLCKQVKHTSTCTIAAASTSSCQA
jgi:hypothetical protein